MKDLKGKVVEKKSTKKDKPTPTFTKPANRFWKRCFGKKKEDDRLHEQITDNNWWEFI